MELTINNRAKLAEALIQLRKESSKKWRQIQISQSTFHRIESCRSSPSIETLSAMLRELGYELRIVAVKKG